MILKSMTLENFRLFKGVHKIVFNNGLNVIVGENATGKSSIMEAVKWCLYGYTNNSMLNFQVANENSENTLSVECVFENDGEDIFIKRFIDFGENNDAISNNLDVSCNDIVLSNPNSFIEDKFPKSTYDLVDGHFADNESTIKYAIDEESGINDLKKLKNELKKFINYCRDATVVYNKIDVGREILEIEDKLNIITKEIGEIDVAINRYNDGIYSIENKLKINPNVFEIIDERKMLVQSLKENHSSILKYENILQSLIVKNLPLLMLYSNCLSSGEFLSFEELGGLYANDELSFLMENYVNLENNLYNLKIDDIDNIFKSISNLKNEQVYIESKIKDIDSQLNMLPELKQDIDLLNKKRFDLENLIMSKDHLTKRKRSLLKQLKNLSKPSREELLMLELYEKLEFVDGVIVSIDELIDELNKQCVQELSGLIKKYFLKYSAFYYDDLILDDEHVISLYKSGIKISPMDLSNAEKDLLNLSLILAIEDISENKFPLMLDTPLSRLDTTFRKSVINMLNDVQVQIILLVNEYEASDLSKDYVLENGVISLGK